jgi:hypothetical protein
LRDDSLGLTQGFVRRFPPDIFRGKPLEQGVIGRVHDILLFVDIFSVVSFTGWNPV